MIYRIERRRKKKRQTGEGRGDNRAIHVQYEKNGYVICNWEYGILRKTMVGGIGRRRGEGGGKLGGWGRGRGGREGQSIDRRERREWEDNERGGGIGEGLG